ncbi:MAG: hypothetical protein AABW99_04155 [archaeon]
MEKPIISNDYWQKAFSLNPVLGEAISNPNTDFMTKLLFDARFFQKKFGKEITYWSSAIFAAKLILSEKGFSAKELAKKAKVPEKHMNEVLSYLKNMAEIEEKNGKFALNYASPFSKMFKS